MSPLITLDGLSFQTPDGRPLLDNLTLAFGAERTGLVGRNGVGKTTLIRLILGELAPAAGGVAVRGRVGVLRQTLVLPPDATVGDRLGVTEALARLARIEAGTGDEADFGEADWGLESRLSQALAQVGLAGLDPARPAASLSGGEATRAALAGLLAAAARDLESAERAAAAVEREIQAAREKKARRDAAGRRYAAKGIEPKLYLGAQAERAENSAARGHRLADRQRDQAAETLVEARGRVERLRRLAFDLPPSGLAAGKGVLAFDAVGFGYPGEAPLISDLSFRITGPERVAVTGPNGSGKTSLIRLAVGELTPTAGQVSLGGTAALLDQQTALLRDAESLAEAFRRLNPEASPNAARAALARFLFRNVAADKQVASLSGGERLRAALACVLMSARPPQLLVLDEPTNHLDLDSIAAVEAALAGYDGALLVVSHDRDFLAAIGIEREVRLGLDPQARPRPDAS